MPPITLTTERLTLRPFAMDDAPALFAIVQEPDIFRYFPTKTNWALEKVERYLKHQAQHWEVRGYGHWAVALTGSGQLMGWCGLEFLPDTNEPEVAYLFSREFWGKGYGTEAASAAVRFGLKDIGLQEIIGLTDPENIASQQVLTKSGLVFTGREFYFGMEMFRFAIQA